MRGHKAPDLTQAVIDIRGELETRDAERAQYLGKGDRGEDLEHALEELLEGDADGDVFLLQHPPTKRRHTGILLLEIRVVRRDDLDLAKSSKTIDVLSYLLQRPCKHVRSAKAWRFSARHFAGELGLLHGRVHTRSFGSGF